MKPMLFHLPFLVMVTEVLSMRRPQSSSSKVVQEKSPPVSSSKSSLLTQESASYPLDHPSSSSNLDANHWKEASTYNDAGAQPGPPRKWAHRFRREKQLMTEVLPRLEKWVEEAKREQEGKEKVISKEEEVMIGMYGKVIKKPAGLFQLKRHLNYYLSNTRRLQDPLFDNFIEKVVELKKQLPNAIAPKLPVHEANARTKAAKQRYKAREKVKAIGVNVKASYLNTGRRRGYKEDEPGYEKYRETLLRRNEIRRIARLQAKNKRLEEVELPVWSHTRPRSKRARPMQSVDIPAWTTKRQRTKKGKEGDDSKDLW